MRRVAITIAVAVLAFGAMAAQSKASIVINGSFERGTYQANGPGYETLYGGSTAIAGWTVIDGSVDWIDTYWTAADGQRSLDLAGLSNGGVLANTVTTVVGQEYLLTFAMAGNPDQNPSQAIKTMKVTVDDIGTQEFTFDSTHSTHTNMGWVWHSLTFTADKTSTLLEFENKPGYSPAYYGAALDDVLDGGDPRARHRHRLVAARCHKLAGDAGMAGRTADCTTVGGRPKTARRSSGSSSMAAVNRREFPGVAGQPPPRLPRGAGCVAF